MRAYPWWKRSHFYFGGDGPNFKPSNSDDVVLSTLGVGLVATCLWAATRHFGIHAVFLYYGAPWLWTNHWIRMLFPSIPKPRREMFAGYILILD
jgi:omega-6 fatty acid desaturase (delta-12 desaturase)